MTLMAASLLFGVGVNPVAHALHFEDVQEVSALDGVGAAVAWSNLAFPEGAGAALLGRADLFADSLAAGSLQGPRPLLLTDSTKLSAATKDELDRLNVTNVTILGGASAVAESVADELRSLGYSVNRLSGANRIETAVAVGRTRTGAARTALLARAFGTSDPTAAFADALSVGAWAADTGWPVLLTESERLSPQTAAFMRENVDQVYAVGGNAAIGETVLTEIRALGVAVRRVSGPSRFDTAVAVADARGFASAGDAPEVVLIDGQSADSWTDGFPAAAYAARKDAPVVLGNSGSASLPPVTQSFLSAGPGAKLVTGWTVLSAQTAEAAEAMGKPIADTGVFQVRMTGRNVVRPSEDATTPIFGHGQPGATGLLTLTADQEAKTLEYVFQGNAEGPYIPTFDKSSGLMLRKAAADQRGPASVVFPSPGSDGKSSGTVGESTFQEGFVLADFMAKPDAYYAEAYTQKFAGGAIRGQLPNGGERHLPARPDFVGITGGQNDDRVTLTFASPVYAPVVGGANGLKPEHFTVTVGGTQTAQVSAVEVATAARDARPTVHLTLNRTAVAGKTTSVALTAVGAGLIQNNLGEKPSAATHSQMTPEDKSAPQFKAVQAIGQAAAVALKFSEPVLVKAQLVGSDFLVKSKSGSTERTHALLNPIPASTTRSDSLVLGLADAIPAGAEVLVTVMATAKPKIADVAGNGLDVDPPVTRSITTTGGGALRSATANDLVQGGGRFNPNRAQDLQITAVVEGPLTAAADTPEAHKSLFLIVPSNSTGVWFDRARAELTYPGATSSLPVKTRFGSRWTFEPLPVSLPSGTPITVSIHDVAVTAGAGSPAAEVRVGRGDSQATVAVTPAIRRGLQISATSTAPFNGADPVLPRNTPAFTQSFAIRVQGANFNGSVSVDLSRLVAEGVSYEVADVTGITTETWGGSPRTRLNLPVNASDGSAVAFSIQNVKVPDKVVENVPIVFTRVGDADAAPTLQLVEILDKSIHSVSVPSAPTWARPTAFTISVGVRGSFGSGKTLKIDLAKNGFVFPSTPSVTAGGTLVSWSGKVASVTPTGPTVTLSWANVDARPVTKTWMVEVSRDDETRDRKTLYQALSGGEEVLLDSLWHSGGSGNMTATNEMLTLVFTHPIVDVVSASVTYYEANPGDPTPAPTVSPSPTPSPTVSGTPTPVPTVSPSPTPTATVPGTPGSSTSVISCSTSGRYKCEIGGTNRNIVTISVLAPPPDANGVATPWQPLPDVRGKKIKTISNLKWGTGSASVSPDSLTVATSPSANLNPATPPP